MKIYFNLKVNDEDFFFIRLENHLKVQERFSLEMCECNNEHKNFVYEYFNHAAAFSCVQYSFEAFMLYLLTCNSLSDFPLASHGA